MKCALHVHTNLSDGELEPQRVIDCYADLGFGMVAITDHMELLDDSYHSIIRSLDHRGMIVVAGVELGYPPWQMAHLLQILTENESFRVLCHPSQYGLSIETVKQRIHSCEFKIDAIEITERGFYQPAYDTQEIPVVKIATDDSHFRRSQGMAWVETGPCRTAQQVFHHIKNGDFSVHYTNALFLDLGLD